MLPCLQYFVPQHALSRFAGWLANSEITWLKNKLIRYFVNKYPVKLDEATIEDPFLYPSFNAFFTRPLKPHLRPIAAGLHDFVSPADGCISTLGNLENGALVQAKGHNFTVLSLLGGEAALAKPFQQGRYATVYLAPQDYHRVHMPMDAYLTEMIYVPGNLFSVNHRTAEYIPELFARNERVVCLFNTSQGRMSMVLVGAMIVGSIETLWAGTITPRLKREIKSFIYDSPIFLRRGEEMGRFKLGSTVIVLTESAALNFELSFITAKNEKVVMGQRIGSFKNTTVPLSRHEAQASSLTLSQS